MILAINTSTMQFSLAVLDEDGTLLTEYFMSGEKGGFKALMPTLDFMLKTASVSTDLLKCISVATGPGSFTGLRVGISLAKGLCHALSLPVAGVSSLEAMANQILHGADLPVVALLTSRRGEAFTAPFKWNQGALKRAGADASLKFEEFSSAFPGPALFVGNDYNAQAPRLGEILGPEARLAPPSFWHLRASSVGSLGLKKYLSGESDDPRFLTPMYLRPPDIRPNPFPLLSNEGGPC